MRKRKKAWVDSLTADEAKHLARRHARHVRAWRTTDWQMGLPKDDEDFITGLRVSRRPATSIFHNEVW